MEIDISTINQFRQAVKNDYGFELKENEAEKALERLTNFFDLLWRYDQEDKQKDMQMKGLKNE